MGGKPRKPVTARFKSTDLFARRIVITIPRGGVVILTLAIVFGLQKALANIASAVAVVSTLVALASILEARHQLRTFRYELGERLTSMVAAYQIPEEDLRMADMLGLLDDDESEDSGPLLWLGPAKRD